MLKKIIYILSFLILSIILFYIFTPGFFLKELTIIYPFDEILFPLDIASPTFRWEDRESGAHNWIVRLEFQDSDEPLEVQTASTNWTPDREMWESIKDRSLEKTAKLTISGFTRLPGMKKLRSSNTISIRTSRDEVGAPIFFRSVTLPFEFAVKNMDTIKWRLGNISSDKPPQIILENMPVCGNCHSFSADGKLFGMDVDYANDKGSYVITEFTEDIKLTKDVVITWSDYKREDQEMTFGLLSQLSPSGKYAVSTVKDRSVFVPKPDVYYSQLFFPIKGILVYYNMGTKSFHAIPGADDKRFVQSNPTWSPDGKYVVFAKCLADTLKKFGSQVVLTQDQCADYLTGGKKFRFDLYRIPFNDGKGGKAEPIKGASNNGMSNYFLKYSPDGKWAVFCQADSFMLLQPDSKLYIMPADFSKEPGLMNCNTNQMNSWHSWSPNSKWLVFSSKVFTPYTQLFLTHIDEDGNDSPPVLLSHFTPPDRAANIPEFVNIKPDYIVNMHERYIDDYSYIRSGYAFGDIYEEYDRAEEEFLKALDINPENIDAHHRLGLVYMKQEKYDKAEKEFKFALENNPDYLSAHYAHYQLGLIHKNRKDYDKAEKEFKAVLKIEPKNFFATHELGYNYMRKKEFDKGEKVFLDLLKISEDYKNNEVDGITSATAKKFQLRAHANLGNTYARKKEYDKAEKEFQTVVHLEPEDFMGHISLGNIYFDSGKIELAIQEFETAYKLNPKMKGLKEDILKLKRLLMQK